MSSPNSARSRGSASRVPDLKPHRPSDGGRSSARSSASSSRVANSLKGIAAEVTEEEQDRPMTPDSPQAVAASLKAITRNVEADADKEMSTSEGLKAAANATIKSHTTTGEDEDEYEDEDFEESTTALMKAAQQEEQNGHAKGKRHPQGLADVAKEIDEEEKQKDMEHEAEEEEEEEVDDEEQDDGLEPLPEADNKFFLRLAFHGHTRKAKDMLSNKEAEEKIKFSVNGGDKHGWTALMWAVSRGHLDFCKFLIERGAIINKRERTNGWTALHLAAINSRLQIAELLVDNGASCKKMDNHGDIPYEMAPRPLKGPAGNAARTMRKLLRPVFKTKSKTRNQIDENIPQNIRDS